MSSIALHHCTDQALIPDFADLYQSEQLSDVTVVVAVEQDAPCLAGTKRKLPDDPEDGSQRINAHGAVLLGFSSWCKSKVCS